jgi:hypothetical protein
MADPPRDSDTGDEPAVELDSESATRRPRWVPVIGIVIAVGLGALVLVLHLTGVLGPGAH